jgi:hypothetical protein
MTDVSRGARSRRGGRGPGWVLLTSLLVLAILASSTLVFTNRVELLRLAVILSLWAAVVAAFVTVIYRRQSELDQSRARDMKFVYDLQLDREISARREYELSVESHLRRTLSREIRAEAADEMAGLRTELAALRTQLEVMLGTDLGHRPALASERAAVPIHAAPGRVESSRITVVAEEVVTSAHEAVIENAIIDVPEEPLVEPVPVPTASAARRPAAPRQPPAAGRRRGPSATRHRATPATGGAVAPTGGSTRPALVEWRRATRTRAAGESGHRARPRPSLGAAAKPARAGRSPPRTGRGGGRTGGRGAAGPACRRSVVRRSDGPVPGHALLQWRWRPSAARGLSPGRPV